MSERLTFASGSINTVNDTTDFPLPILGWNNWYYNEKTNVWQLLSSNTMNSSNTIQCGYVHTRTVSDRYLLHLVVDTSQIMSPITSCKVRLTRNDIAPTLTMFLACIAYSDDLSSTVDYSGLTSMFMRNEDDTASQPMEDLSTVWAYLLQSQLPGLTTGSSAGLLFGHDLAVVEFYPPRSENGIYIRCSTT